MKIYTAALIAILIIALTAIIKINNHTAIAFISIIAMITAWACHEGAKHKDGGK